MTFNAGELVATIRLEGVDQVERGVDRVGQKMAAGASTASRFGDAAKAALRGAATLTLGASVAAAAYTANLFQTGVAYNTLQQTSRAALKTLVGGAQQANDQMAALDAFARNSPFSKSVFITAQQQLIGFGMEAKKVIPTLDAVQQAVAATGGSSQSLGDIVFILAQIQAAGKITGQDLMQLGQRGINAAELIGSQMGKTGQQIKDEISEGALDAGAALDALTAGMSAKFAGAAANVKGTWEGTKDRIKAASREIGAALAEPFVSQQGGGLAVTWGNQVADIMRAVLGHTTPVVNLLTGRALPAFAGITEALDHARVVVKSWDSSRLEGFLNRLGDYAPVVAGFATAWATVGLQGVPVLGRFLAGINPLVAGLTAFALSSQEVRDAGAEVLGSLEPLLPVMGDLADVAATGLVAVLPVVATGLTTVAQTAKPLVDIIASIPTPVLAAVAGFVLMQRTLGPLKGVVEAAFRALSERAAVQASLAAMEGSTGRFAGTLGVVGKAATGAGNAIKAAFISNPVGIALLAISGAVALVTSALASGSEEASEHRKVVNQLKDAYVEANGAIDAARESVVRQNLETRDAQKFADEIGVSMETVTAAALGSADAYSEVSAAARKWENEGGTSGKSVAQMAFEGTAMAGKDLVDVIDDQISAHQDAVIAAQEYREAQRQSAAAMTDFERSNARMNDALAIARDVTKDATERLNALKSALDELNGGTKTQTDLQRDLNEQGDRLAEAFAAADENGNKLAAGLVDASGAIDTTTTAGRGLYDETKRLNDEMLDAILAADEAAKAQGRHGASMDEAQAAAQPYIDKLRQIATDADLSSEQVDGLVQTMLDTPSVVAFALTDDGTIDASRLRAIDLATQILATPDKTIEIDDTTPEVKRALELLGLQVEQLPNGKVQISADGIESLESALETLTRNRTVHVDVVAAGNPSDAWLKKPNADGNLYSGFADPFPTPFANGGFPTGIYAGRSGGIHKFAEPETRWEAYISGKAGQESRNRAIATEAVSRLGGVAAFANGGITAFASGGIAETPEQRAERLAREKEQLREWLASQRTDWNTSLRRGEARSAGMNGNGLSLVDQLFTVAEQIGGTTMKRLRAVALASEKSFLALEKQSAKADAQLEKASSKLQGLKDAASSMASSVAGAVRRFFNLGEIGKVTTETQKVQVTKQVGSGRDAYWETAEEERTTTTKPTGASLKTAFASKAAGIKRFADKLAKLTKKGLTGALLAEIAQLGVEAGEPIADALLGATAEEFKSINASYGQIDKYSDLAGQTVADANYKKLITAAENQVAAAKKNSDAIEARLKKETDRIITAIGGALSFKPKAFGSITAMAGGGVRPPMIAKGGSNILWAEAGDEAYIPLDPRMRSRSIPLWEETGRRIGIPAMSSTAGPGSVDRSEHMSVTYHAAPTSQGLSDQRQLTRAVQLARRATRR